MVRRGCRTGHGREVLDRGVRLRHGRRPAVHRTTPRVSQQMDLAGRARRFSDLSAESAVEHPLWLAVRTTDSQHQSGWPRRRTGTRSILSATGLAGESTHLADLAEGIALSSVRGSAQTVPRAGMVLSGLLRRFLRAAR